MVVRAIQLPQEAPSRAAQGPRPYKLSLYVLYKSIKIGNIKVSVFYNKKNGL